MNRETICARIPHAGSMCLLERIESWDQDGILALAGSHRDSGNPLRGEYGLHAVCAVEYAAQAMAVHASLVAENGSPPSVGFLMSVRDLRFVGERLDAYDDDLRIQARRQTGSEDSFIYTFEISAQAREIASGRVAVKLMGALVR